MTKLPSSVYVIKMGYWCNLKGVEWEVWGEQSEEAEIRLRKQPGVLDAVWSPAQSAVFEIEIDTAAVTSLYDLDRMDKLFRKIISDCGMKIED